MRREKKLTSRMFLINLRFFLEEERKLKGQKKKFSASCYSLEFSSFIFTDILLSFSDSSCDSSFGFAPSFICFFWIFFTFAR
jgi:hypothetical protein